MPATWPPLTPLIEPFLGKPYGEHECWRLVCELLHVGGFVDVPDDPAEAVEKVAEVWFHDDPRDPLAVVQPWDWCLMRKSGRAIEHIGLVVEPHSFIHVREKVGVCVEPLKRWRVRLVQIARLRCLF